MRDIDRVVTATSGQDVAVAGNFIFLKSSNKPLTIEIDGQSVDMRQGDRYAAGKVFKGFRIENANSVDVTATLIVGFGDYGRSEISGVVEIVDGGRARTNEGIAFAYGHGVLAVAAQYTHIQLWNPAASGKKGILNDLMVSAAAQTQINIGLRSTAISTLAATPNSKGDNYGASALQIREENNVAKLANDTAGFFTGVVQAFEKMQTLITEPIIIEPGQGLTMHTVNVNTTAYLTVQYYEEDE